MLSKVAERLLWTARYLERAESTARMINIYDQLLFDLPRSVELSWYNLIIINQLEAEFLARYTIKDERNIVKFMLGDASNPSSVVSSLKATRENVRTTRDVLVQETWEMVNELSLFVQNNLSDGLTRRRRHEFLGGIVKGCQQIQGLLFNNMPRDTGWDFLALGQNLERSDMTTRLLDAGLAELQKLKAADNIYAQQLIIGNVLRSLNAELPYRRNISATVSTTDVMQYLLEDQELPRAIAFGIQKLLIICTHLPKNQAVISALKTFQEQLLTDIEYTQGYAQMRDVLNDMQIALADIHSLIAATWFPAPEPLEIEA